MEFGIKSLDGIKNASLDFVSKILRLEFENDSDVNKLVEEVEHIIKRIEHDIKLIEIKKNKSSDSKLNEAENNQKRTKELIILGLGAVLFTAASIFSFTNTIELALYFISYILVGSEVLIKSARNIIKGQIFDENFLMSIATIGAFAVGEYSEGVAVMLFYQVGELFQDMAVNRSRKSITALMDIRPDFANLKIGEETKLVSPEEVNVGDLIIVKPGEKIPLDGKVVEGNSMVDTSALTGEAVPREVYAGDDVLGGFINKNGLLTIKITKEFEESTVSKILDLVQNASSRKAPTENFITKFARYYTPVVVFTALGLALIPPLLLDGASFADWLYRALIFLVVSCPCALVISIPLGFFGGIGGASKKGILIKGSNFLEALNSVDTVVFDKTGTLTKGVFKVTKVKPIEGIEENALLEYAAYAESYSNHPIAASILKEYGRKIDKSIIQEYKETPGYGTIVMVDGHEVMAGNNKLMEAEAIEYIKINETGTAVHLAIDNRYLGYIVISDELKEDSKQALQDLKNIGVKKTVMLTGDISAAAYNVGNELGVDIVYAELLPDHKVEKLEELELEKAPGTKLIFAGDGINDAPVLSRADIGIAMGGLGSDAAIEAADIVIMTDEPSKIASAIKIAKYTRKIVWQNIIFALGIKASVLILGAFGYATMWEAVFADVGVAIIAVLNSMRVLNVRDI